MICEQLDEDAEKYADICEKRSIARKNKTQQMITKDNNCKQVLSSATDNDNDNDNDNVNDNDTVIDNDNVKVIDKKHIYGEYKHVRLTDAELDRLYNDYGEQETHAAIKFLDEYKERKGYKSKNDNLTLRNWVFKAVKERSEKSNVPEDLYDKWMNA